MDFIRRKRKDETQGVARPPELGQVNGADADCDVLHVNP